MIALHRYPRTAVSWLGRRIELNRAAVILGSLALGVMLAGLVYVERRDSANAADERTHLAAVNRAQTEAIRRIRALELPTADNVKELVARYLRRQLAHALELRRQAIVRRRAERHHHAAGPPASSSPAPTGPPSTSSPSPPATPAPGRPGQGPGPPGPPGGPAPSPPAPTVPGLPNLPELPLPLLHGIP